MIVVKTDNAPKAIGPYSQAIVANGFLFVSGQLPINPTTNEIDSDNHADQCRQSLQNIESIAKAAGADLTRVVKTTVLMTDLTRFGEVNSVYSEFFPEHRPARTTFEASALPKGALVEIDAIIALPAS